ncbi:efflux RND transporter permease subunit [Pseudoxanthomonas mexicana]|uniref:efflux RND transporter permease subunit n=1 Tax=Pseudoxanthomonas mexicana TaxID=128785 RepID=UPI00387E58B0
MLLAIPAAQALDGVRPSAQVHGRVDQRSRIPRMTQGAAMHRLLMTALVAAPGFVLMALATGTGAEAQRLPATFVIDGLATATATSLTMVVLPMLHLNVARLAEDALLPGGSGNG